jgi:phosphoesterase RecJ-like protein
MVATNRFHVSLRSDGAVDVAAIAAMFGGGGHSSAAGFSIEATLSSIKSRIFSLADKI